MDFPIYNIDNAPEDSQLLLKTAKDKFGEYSARWSL